MKKYFKAKSIDRIMQETTDEHNPLHRHLDATHLTLLGIGAIIGAGIFVLSGQAAAQYAGPAISLSFVFSGVACVFAGLCYAEFASLIPIAGSAYTYSYATLGEFFAWIIGWDLILEYLFASATVAVGWSGYFVSFLRDCGIVVPKAIAESPFKYDAVHGLEATGAFINLPAIFILALMTVLLVIGIRETARFNNVIVAIKIGVILLFLLFSFRYINIDNWTPFIPENEGVYGRYGWSGIMRGAGVVFFAYIGFDAVSTAAQEAKNPQKDMPVGILGSLLICTFLYISVALVMTGIVKYTLLDVPDPIAVSLDAVGDSLIWLRPWVKAGAIAGLSSVILVMLMGQPRIFYAMSRDGLLPPIFSKVHPRFKTPYVSTIITGLVAIVIGGLFPIGVLGELVSIGTLLAFTMVCGGVLVLRYTKPNLKRYFKTPFVPYVPILGMVFSLMQMLSLPRDTWLRLIVWMALGFIIYFTYGHKHSVIQKQQ